MHLIPYLEQMNTFVDMQKICFFFSKNQLFWQ